jgi:GDP-L-fucose synthase
VIEVTRFGGEVFFDAEKPSGERRRVSSAAQARRVLGFEARWSLREGLERTLDWYRAAREAQA